MILCDTNILIEFYKGSQNILAVFHEIGPSNLAISVITMGELYCGVKDKRELRKIQKHLTLLQQIPLDWMPRFQHVLSSCWGITA